jgi:hypothetical protein
MPGGRFGFGFEPKLGVRVQPGMFVDQPRDRGEIDLFWPLDRDGRSRMVRDLARDPFEVDALLQPIHA